MLKVGKVLQLSASDLVSHLNCRYLTDLDLEVVNGARDKPRIWDPLLEVLWERGATHERNYVEHLRRAGYAVVEIEGTGITPVSAGLTLAAMRAGAEIIVQAALLHEAWSGRADILRRVNVPSALGDWSYEVIDTKLARETKGGTVLQLCLYSDLLSLVQGHLPEYMHVVIPGLGYRPQTYRTSAFAAYYRHVKRGLEQSLVHPVEATIYPDPKEHCQICRWRTLCDARRRKDDHLCLVAGITKIQIAELNRHGVATLAGLSGLALPLPWKPERGSRQSYERAREQARVQIESRAAGRPVYEPLSPLPGAGFARLPAPSPGDIFFDLEGDPFVGENGLEFLFGYVTAAESGERDYVGEWAFAPEQEKRAFERFVDFVMARWAQHPDLHIYHYSPYEPSALKRLMGRYATREDEIDRMLRAAVFVDLYSIVRQSIRAGIENYTIKNLECFYEYRRSIALEDARRELVRLQASLELGHAVAISDAGRRVVAGYNKDDCISAMKLREWLEKIRVAMNEAGASIARPPAPSPEPTEVLSERQRRVTELVARLTADVPIATAERSAEQHAHWIVAHVLDWHRREQKAVWWEFFRLSDLPAEDLTDERTALAGLTFLGVVGGTARAPIHRYGFPPQETELRGSETLYSAGGAKLGKAEAISLEHRTIDIKKRGDTAANHPQALFAHDAVSTDVPADALLRIGEYVAEHGIGGAGRYQAARDLLLRVAPQIGLEPLRQPGESPVTAAVRIAPKLTGGILPIQGPPGAGKTFTASRMICALVAGGAKVGVTANSHKVIRNVLDKALEAASEARMELRCIQKVGDSQDDVGGLRFTTKNEEVFAMLGTSCQVAAGTAWLWAREEAFESVDVLFVDEAAQMSLANVLAVSHACRTLVLLGDPQQLEQPMQGSHPEGTDVSALDHLLQGKATIEDDRGLFLEETWRLHPDICTFTSEQFYEGRLRSRAGLERQTIRSSGTVQGSGLRYLPVSHEGNQSCSREEAERIGELVQEILRTRSTWIDAAGRELPVTLGDILIIAPYNAQVFELQDHLPGARIGTVDKFQGQEAPVVIYSMTTSSHADAPRGMEFLYSLNRLNVATSRARCICILVGSPTVFEAECKTPRQMQLANAFCRYLEMAQGAIAGSDRQPAEIS